MRSEEAFGSPASDCSEGQKKERRRLRERGRERLRLVALPRQRPAEHGVGRVEEALRVVEVAAAQQIEDGKDQRLGEVTALEVGEGILLGVLLALDEGRGTEEGAHQRVHEAVLRLQLGMRWVMRMHNQAVVQDDDLLAEISRELRIHEEKEVAQIGIQLRHRPLGRVVVEDCSVYGLAGVESVHVTPKYWEPLIEFIIFIT